MNSNFLEADVMLACSFITGFFAWKNDFEYFCTGDESSIAYNSSETYVYFGITMLAGTFLPLNLSGHDSF